MYIAFYLENPLMTDGVGLGGRSDSVELKLPSSLGLF